MCQPGKWWRGLLPLLVLWLGLNRLETERIETELAARADMVLGETTGAPGVSVGAGRDIILKGAIFDPATRPVALAAAQAIPGVRQVRDELAPPSPIAPFLWRASLDKDVVTLSGAVDNPASREALLATAQKAAPQARILDQMTYFSGGPTGFLGKAAGALGVLAHLTAGQAQLSGSDLSVVGQAASAAEWQAAQAAVKQVEGVTLVKVDLSDPKVAAAAIVASPYLFSAHWGGKDLELQGFYPDEDAHAKLLARAGTDFPRVTVKDHLKRGVGAPKSFVESALAGLDQLARLKIGDLSLRDRTASLNGEATGAETADEAKAAFVAGQPGGYAVETHLTGAAREPTPVQPPAAAQAAAQAAPPAAPLATPPAALEAKAAIPPIPAKQAAASPPLDAGACQAGLMKLVRQSPILFQFASAEIEPASATVLDALAAAAQKCPEVSFEVSGHTDDVGHKQRNMLMSRRRAENVVAYMIRAGVAAGRLSAQGYGESRPLVPNDSDENRAKNRRIEFNVQ